MRWWLLLVLAGCNEVLGIEKTETFVVDTDADGVIEERDNCPHEPNAGQSNDDGDEHGDLCDNCPLVENREQADFDMDGIGDLCDPHPKTVGDCLILHESFLDPASLAEHDVMPTGVPPMLEVTNGHLRIMATEEVAILAKGLTGTFATMMRATVGNNAKLRVGVASNLSATNRGYRCVYELAAGAQVEANGAALDGELTSGPVNPLFIARLAVVDAINGAPDLGCRIDYGVALGLSQPLFPIPRLVGGSPGVIVSQQTVDVAGVAYYRFDSAPCQPTVRR